MIYYSKFGTCVCFFHVQIEMAKSGSGEFSFGNGTARNGLPKIHTTSQRKQSEICHDDSTPPVRAQTIDELHSLQKKRSTPTTPIQGTQGAFTSLSEEERYKQQLQSIRFIYTRNSPNKNKTKL